MSIYDSHHAERHPQFLFDFNRLVPQDDVPGEDVPLDLGFKSLGCQGMHCCLVLEWQVAQEHPEDHHAQAPGVTFERVPGASHLFFFHALKLSATDISGCLENTKLVTGVE